jgi:hypothetical protein
MHGQHREHHSLLLYLSLCRQASMHTAQKTPFSSQSIDAQAAA